MRTPPVGSAHAVNQELLDVDELKIPAAELLALIQDAIEVAGGFRSREELSLIDQQPCRPRAMLAALIYCYLRGVYGSEQIEEAFKWDAGLRAIAPCRPDRELLRNFRRAHRELIQQALRHLHWFLAVKYRPMTQGVAAARLELSVRIEFESDERLSRAAFVDNMSAF
jgi:hypothetical protein